MLQLNSISIYVALFFSACFAQSMDVNDALHRHLRERIERVLSVDNGAGRGWFLEKLQDEQMALSLVYTAREDIEELNRVLPSNVRLREINQVVDFGIGGQKVNSLIFLVGSDFPDKMRPKLEDVLFTASLPNESEKAEQAMRMRFLTVGADMPPIAVVVIGGLVKVYRLQISSGEARWTLEHNRDDSSIGSDADE